MHEIIKRFLVFWTEFQISSPYPSHLISHYTMFEIRLSGYCCYQRRIIFEVFAAVYWFPLFWHVGFRHSEKKQRCHFQGSIFYVLLTVHFSIFLVNIQLDANFFNMFISVLYMFRAAMCSSSGESIVSIRYLVYVTLCRWPSSMQFHPSLHTGRSPIQSDIYQMSYWYNWLSWWWAHGCPKRVENWNKHVKKKKNRTSKPMKMKIVFLRSSRNRLFIDVAPCPRRTEPSTTPLWEQRNSRLVFCICSCVSEFWLTEGGPLRRVVRVEWLHCLWLLPFLFMDWN